MPLNPIILFVPGIEMMFARILIMEAGEYIGNSGVLLIRGSLVDMG